MPVVCIGNNRICWTTSNFLFVLAITMRANTFNVPHLTTSARIRLRFQPTRPHAPMPIRATVRICANECVVHLRIKANVTAANPKSVQFTLAGTPKAPKRKKIKARIRQISDAVRVICLYPRTTYANVKIPDAFNCTVRVFPVVTVTSAGVESKRQ